MVLHLAMLVPHRPCSERPLALAMRHQVSSKVALLRSSLRWKSSSCCRRVSRWLRARLRLGDCSRLLLLKTVSMSEVFCLRYFTVTILKHLLNVTVYWSSSKQWCWVCYGYAEGHHSVTEEAQNNCSQRHKERVITNRKTVLFSRALFGSASKW